jgi:uncharacterized protein (DUF433 family)
METLVKPHITFDADGVAHIDGLRYKVIHLASEALHQHASAEEIHESHPDLSLAQIHAALAFYYDHKAEFDAQMEEDDRFAERMRAEMGQPPFVERLRAEKERRQQTA